MDLIQIGHKIMEHLFVSVSVVDSVFVFAALPTHAWLWNVMINQQHQRCFAVELWTFTQEVSGEWMTRTVAPKLFRRMYSVAWPHGRRTSQS